MPLIIRHFKNLKITTDMFIVNFVMGGIVSYSIIGGVEVMWWIISEEYKTYNFPEEYVNYIVIGAIGLIISTLIAYWSTCLKKAIKKPEEVK